MFLGLRRPDTVMSPRRWRLAAAVAVGVALVVVAGLLLPGAGLRWGVVRLFQRLGMAEVKVSDADLSLFGGRVVVHRVEARPGSGAALGLQDFDLIMRWRPLLDRRVSVQSLALDGLSIDLRQENGILVVNGLPLTVGGAGDGGKPWSFDADAVHLTGSTVRYTDQTGSLLLDIDVLDLDALRSWDGDQPIHIRFKGRLDGAPIEVRGTATPFAATPGLNLDLSVERLDVAPLAAVAGLRGLAGRLTAGLTVTGSLEPDGVRLQADGGAGLTAAAMDFPGGRLSADALDWRGRLAIGPTMEGAGTVQVRKIAATMGDMAVSADTAVLDGQRIGWSRDGASFSGNATVSRLAAHSTRGDASMDALAFAAQALDYRAKDGSLDWQGSVNVQSGRIAAGGITAEPGRLGWQGHALIGLAGPSIHLEGRLDDDGGRADTGMLQAELRHLDASGTFDLAPALDGTPAPAANLDINAAGVAVHDQGGVRDLAQADAVQAAELRLTPGQPVVARRLEARAVAVLRGRGGRKGGYPWRVEAARLRMDGGALGADGGLSAQALAMDGLLLRLTRTKNGFVGLQASREDSKGGGGDAAMPHLAIGRLTVGGKSLVDFEDRSLDSPVRLQVSNLELAASGLDSGRPDADSPFDLKAQIGSSTLGASGTAQPFAPRLTARMRGRVTAFELPPLSPYAADMLGVELQTGHFDGDLNVQADQGSLDGKVDLKLSNLFVAQPDPNAPIARQAKMPVATVLDLLRDGEDNIRLTIPVSGNLADPQFDVSDAVAQAVGGALRSTALTTLKVLFPVAALIELAASDDGMVLDPLNFAPGGEALDDASRARLATLGELMRSRPSLALSLCGLASIDTDWPVLLERRKGDELGVLYKLQKLMNIEAKPASTTPDADALDQLAQRRADAVKDWLADSGGIAPARLYSCRPAIEPKGTPRVELKL